MKAKERIMSLRLIEKLNKNPDLAKRLVIKASVKRVKKLKANEDGKNAQL